MAKKRFFQESELIFLEHSKDPKFQDLTGRIFGKLKVIGFAGKYKRYHSQWFCRCECQNIIKAYVNNLNRGHTNSCGCFLIEKVTTHGHARDGGCSSTYNIWKSMNQRCQNPKHPEFHNYGGRGIRVCDRWEESFENFLTDMGVRPGKEYSIDRYPDQNGGYCPENCRWATMKEQQNNKRNNRVLTYNGETKTISQWADYSGINRSTLQYRLNSDWPLDKALDTHQLFEK